MAECDTGWLCCNNKEMLCVPLIETGRGQGLRRARKDQSD